MADRHQPNKWMAIASCKCPQCQSGKMFPYPFWNLRHFSDMDTHCRICSLKFEIEPGFFWGAMYVSYTLTVGMMLVMAGLILWISNGSAGFWTYVIPIVTSLVASIPVTFRYARVLMLYFFASIDYRPELSKK